MKLGVLGTGNVGQVIGRGLVEAGHQVMMGSRDPQQEKVRGWVQSVGKNASSGTFAEAAAFGEAAVLATSWSGTAEALRLAEPANLAGKLVIDATNPLEFSQGAPRLAVGHTDSAGEQVQRLLPQARVVKAFNMVGNQHMVHPQFAGGPPDMFICGNDAEAKAKTEEILKSFGWSVVDMGGIDRSRYIEPLAMLWILHSIHTHNGDHAFKLLRK